MTALHVAAKTGQLNVCEIILKEFQATKTLVS